MSRMPAATVSVLKLIVDDVVNDMDLRSAFLPTFTMSGRPDGDGDGDDNEEDDSEDDSGEDDDSNDDDDASGAKSKSQKDVKDPEKKRLHEEAGKHRNAAKVAAKERDALAVKLKEYEDKDKSEVEKLQGDLKSAQDDNKALRETTKTQGVRLAFFESGAASQFKNAGTALRLLDLDGIEPDDEGVVDADEIKKRAKALGEKEPYLLKDGDEGDLGEDEGQPSGKSTNGKKKSKGDLDRAKLEDKYPALRGRA